MAEDATPRRCFKCGKSDIEAPHVLCAGCRVEIENAVIPWDDVLRRAKEVSSKYR